MAKERFAEELTSKHERMMFASDPMRIGIVKEKNSGF